MPERRTWRSEGKGRGEWKEENESAIGVFCISGLLLHWLLCLDSNLFLLRKARDLQSVFLFFFFFLYAEGHTIYRSQMS